MDLEAFLAVGAFSVLLALVLLSGCSWLGSWLVKEYKVSELHRSSSRH